MNRHAWVILTALLLLIAAPAEAARSITFEPSVLKPGDSWTDRSSFGTSITFERNDSFRSLAPEPRSTSVDRTKRVTVTDVTPNGKIGAVEVTYSAVVRDGVDRTSSFAGKTYVVTLQGNKASEVKYLDGTQPPPEEAAFVVWDNNRHDQVRAMNRTFGGETVTIGQELPAKAPDDLIDVDSGMTLVDFSMTLQSISADGKEATFAVILELANSMKKRKDASATDEEPFGSVRLKLQGTLVATKTSRITSIQLSGPATVNGSKSVEGGSRSEGTTKVGREMTIAGTGTGTWTTSYVYP